MPLLYVFPLFNLLSVFLFAQYVFERVREQLATTGGEDNKER